MSGRPPANEMTGRGSASRPPRPGPEDLCAVADDFFEGGPVSSKTVRSCEHIRMFAKKYSARPGSRRANEGIHRRTSPGVKGVDRIDLRCCYTAHFTIAPAQGLGMFSQIVQPGDTVSRLLSHIPERAGGNRSGASMPTATTSADRAGPLSIPASSTMLRCGFRRASEGSSVPPDLHDGLTALENLNHRGACGSEPNTGDGAGMLIQVPHEFFRHECAALGIRLPEAGHYGVGMFFASPDQRARDQAMALFTAIVEEEGQHLLGWRDVPVVSDDLGESALAAEPTVHQVFIGRGSRRCRRRRLRARALHHPQAVRAFGRPLGYPGRRGVLLHQPFLPDAGLQGHAHGAAAGPVLPGPLESPRDQRDRMFHSRFSTNTFPSWKLAHPYRMVAHNGEINTLRGNINWMTAREALFRSPHFPVVSKILPVIEERGSDTASLDNALELLVRAGRPIAARDDDADPRSLERPRVDARREEGVLRVPQLPDGAVGRPRIGRVHRRQARSAPCSTGTGSGHPGTTSPRTTS